MNISGSGTIAAGEYNEEIHISGSGHIGGAVRCTKLSCSGSAKVDGDLDVTGGISTAGAFSVHGNVRAGGQCKMSGAVKIDGDIKTSTLNNAGFVKIGGGIEAETVVVHGCLNCGGLLNAENVEIEFEDGGHVAAVGGGKITICRKDKQQKKAFRLPLFKRIAAQSCDLFTVDESIEGDTVAVEYVSANTVTGRVVAIGEGCEIGTVRYGEEVEISPDAKVEHVEKEG